MNLLAAITQISALALGWLDQLLISSGIMHLPLPLLALGATLVFSWLSSAAISVLAVANLNIPTLANTYGPDFRIGGIIAIAFIAAMEMTHQM